MPETPIDERCRLVLVATRDVIMDFDAQRLGAALGAGDVASIIMPAFELEERPYADVLERAMAEAAKHDVAVLSVDDTRAAGRAGIDGVHLTGSLDVVEDAAAKFGDKWIVGCGGATTRDEALRFGELGPDYMFFGRLDRDERADAHPKNIALVSWWATMVEIPCIVQGGSDLDTLSTSAATGAEFVALSHAIFAAGADPARAVAKANEVLDQHPLKALA